MLTEGPLTVLEVQISTQTYGTCLARSPSYICLLFDIIHAASFIAFGLRSLLSGSADAFLLQQSQQLTGASFSA